MLDKLKTWHAQVSLYLLGGVTLLAVGLGVGWHVSDLRLKAANSALNEERVKLSVTIASVTTLKTELDRTVTTLKENERVENEKKKAIAERLKALAGTDKKYIDMEARLKSRPTQLNCTVPDDLKEAWNAL